MQKMTKGKARAHLWEAICWRRGRSERNTHVEDVALLTGKSFCVNHFMNFLFWNCRRARNNGFCAVVHGLRRLFHCNVLAVVEPRVSGVRVDKIIEKFKFEYSLRVEAQGMSGGIWLLWNQSRISRKIMDSSRHFIHGIMNEGNTDAWLFTVVYANPNPILKKQCFDGVA